MKERLRIKAKDFAKYNYRIQNWRELICEICHDPFYVPRRYTMIYHSCKECQESYTKKCRAEAHASFNKTNRTEIRKWNKKWYADHRDKNDEIYQNMIQNSRNYYNNKKAIKIMQQNNILNTNVNINAEKGMEQCN